MKLAVLSQQEGETRVALTPAVVKSLTTAGHEVLIETGAGLGSHANDTSYQEAGAKVVSGVDATTLCSEVDIVLTINPPSIEQVSQMRGGAVLVGMLSPLSNLELIKALANRAVTAISLEFIPRITRAQAMDVLSSQANMAGYKAVILAADACPKMFPMMMTAAGTIAPSRVFVIGAGVAGLQAIATAKRLGAIVEAYDVRPEVEEQVQSLGGRFVKLPTTKQETSTSGGYAKQQTDEERRQQVELMTKHVMTADAVITTAAIFGKAPPLLIPADVVRQMRSGSVIVDIAADTQIGRGNCEMTKPGQRCITDNGVIIEGTLNLPGCLPVHASQAYANNLQALLKEMIDTEGNLKLDQEDEIQNSATITHAGQVVNTMVMEAIKT